MPTPSQQFMSKVLGSPVPVKPSPQGAAKPSPSMTDDAVQSKLDSLLPHEYQALVNHAEKTKGQSLSDQGFFNFVKAQPDIIDSFKGYRPSGAKVIPQKLGTTPTQFI